MLEERTHYEILEVEPTASEDEIKASYRRLIRKYHPDVNPGVENETRTSLMTLAKSVLLDAEKRKEYDLELSGGVVEEAVAPEWSPSWGEEATWEEDVDEDDPFAFWGDEGNDSADPSWWDDWNKPGSTRNDFYPPPEESPPAYQESYNPIKTLPPLKIPDEIRSGAVHFKSRKVDATVAVALAVLSPLVASVTYFSGTSLIFVWPVLGFIAAALTFLYSRTFKRLTIFPPVFTTLSTVGVYALIAGLVRNIETPDVQSAIFHAAFAGSVGMLTGSSFWGYWEQRKILKPKMLLKNNSFGSSQDPVEESLEDILNPLWDIPGLRVFRQSHPAFSHLLMLGKRVVLLKPVHLKEPGVLKVSGHSVLAKGVNGLYERILPGSYQPELLEFSYSLPDDVEVYPMIVAFPSQFLKSFEHDEHTAFVTADDVCSLVGSSLLDGVKENVVDHELATKIIRASFKPVE